MNSESISIEALASSIPAKLIKNASALKLIPMPGLLYREKEALIGQLVNLMKHANGLQQTTLMWLGDALASLQPQRGKITELAKNAEVSVGTLRNVKMVCTRIEPSCRRDALSWSHHMEVGMATDDKKQIANWLDIAIREQLSVRELRKRIKESVRSKSTSDISGKHAGSPLDPWRKVLTFVEEQRGIWEKWTPQERQVARANFGPLLEFAEFLGAKTSMQSARS